MQSAALAGLLLNRLEVPGILSDEISRFILATAEHKPVPVKNKTDLEYFLDFDMAILAANWEVYEHYMAAIRQEYAIYPDDVYKQGRIAFIQQTLSRPIYYTPAFKKLERKARTNMQRELMELTGT